MPRVCHAGAASHLPPLKGCGDPSPPAGALDDARGPPLPLALTLVPALALTSALDLALVLVLALALALSPVLVPALAPALPAGVRYCLRWALATLCGLKGVIIGAYWRGVA